MEKYGKWMEFVSRSFLFNIFVEFNLKTFTFAYKQFWSYLFHDIHQHYWLYDNSLLFIYAYKITQMPAVFDVIYQKCNDGVFLPFKLVVADLGLFTSLFLIEVSVLILKFDSPKYLSRRRRFKH